MVFVQLLSPFIFYFLTHLPYLSFNHRPPILLLVSVVLHQVAFFPSLASRLPIPFELPFLRHSFLSHSLLWSVRRLRFSSSGLFVLSMFGPFFFCFVCLWFVVYMCPLSRVVRSGIFFGQRGVSPAGYGCGIEQRFSRSTFA